MTMNTSTPIFICQWFSGSQTALLFKKGSDIGHFFGQLVLHIAMVEEENTIFFNL